MQRHLKNIKAKIEQKSIHNMKLPFEGPFKKRTQTDRQNASYVRTPSLVHSFILLVILAVLLFLLFFFNVQMEFSPSNQSFSFLFTRFRYGNDRDWSC